MMPNNTSHLSSDCAPYNPVTTNMVVACLFFLTFPVALVLNGVAVWVSLHLRSISPFIVYLKHLMVADMLMTLTFPLKAASMLPGAALELRAFSCRYINAIFNTSLYISIALMGLISLDRFFKIVRPCGKVLGQNVLFSIVMSSLVWVVLIGCTAGPGIILADQPPYSNGKSICMSLKGPAGLRHHNFVVSFMEFLFWCVSILIVFSYICITIKILQSFRKSGSNNTQGKKKTKLWVFLILLVYFVCFVPLHFLRFCLLMYQNSDICIETTVIIAHKLAIWLSSTNTCLDPFLYIYLCKEYREKLINMMKGSSICIIFWKKNIFTRAERK